MNLVSCLRSHNRTSNTNRPVYHGARGTPPSTFYISTTTTSRYEHRAYPLTVTTIQTSFVPDIPYEPSAQLQPWPHDLSRPRRDHLLKFAQRSLMLLAIVTALGESIREAGGWIGGFSVPDPDMNMRWLKTLELLGAGLFAASPLVVAQADCSDYTTYAGVRVCID